MPLPKRRKADRAPSLSPMLLDLPTVALPGTITPPPPEVRAAATASAVALLTAARGQQLSTEEFALLSARTVTELCATAGPANEYWIVSFALAQLALIGAIALKEWDDATPDETPSTEFLTRVGAAVAASQG